MRRLAGVLLLTMLFIPKGWAADAISLQKTVFTSATTATPIGLSNSVVAYHQITWYVTGTVSACSVRVDSSADGVTWNAGDVIGAQTCTSTGQSTVSNAVYAYVRVNVTSFTGTAGSSTKVVYAGYQDNPAGSGSAGGVDTNVQYNDAGAFGGDSGLTYDKTTHALTTSGQITSTVSTGTAPLVIASTTQVSNLNASKLIGGTWAVPGTIGSTTPNTVAASTLAIGGGATITGHLSATATLNFGDLATIGCEDLTIAVSGAADGDTVAIGVPNGSVPGATATFTGWVSAPDVVTVRYCDLVGGNPASGTFRADVWKH